MDADAYRYSENGRRPATIAALACAFGMLLLGLRFDAPVVWLIVVGLPALALLVLVVGNARTWLVVAADGLTWHDARRQTRISRDRIARLEVRAWSDSTDVVVHLVDGDSVVLPDRCRPDARRLADELAARGYVVEGDAR